ncbi:E3 ubiquitin-protein ligase TRIM71 [Geobacter sp. OR-1]|uniref:hypothetical protein n=1 Tax=Geobacter sp. OR-1 TaxID=1266765 RepID=UPI000544427F|nr:hypothetical protein [Geobacter sp. OR-1]GAM08941.1 E3 ubiquitin-protein ligase TRIM71 [Geobacter sp. OR-1]
MRLIGIICLYIACFAGNIVLGGCAAPTQTGPVKVERYFWPPLPDTPRIEFIGAYTGAASLKEKETGLFATLLGDEEAPPLLSAPINVTADGMGKVFLVDNKSSAVVTFDLKARTAGVFGTGDTQKMFSRGSGIGIDADGNVYTGDALRKKIFVLDKTGKMTAVYDVSSYIDTIGGLAIDKTRKRIVVPDIKGHKIVLLGLDGSYIASVGKRGPGDADFNYPTGVAIDKEGNIIVADSMNARVQRLTPDLKFINKFGKRGDGTGEMAVIKGVAVDSEGHIYVTDGKMNKVMIFNDRGEILLQFGGTYNALPGLPIGPGGFSVPMGIYIDQNDTIYVADQHNGRFHVYQYMNEKYTRENPY